MWDCVGAGKEGGGEGWGHGVGVWGCGWVTV